ncbi:MAG: magnesium/cobalt transporter CorA [Gammaproteobacteria bacterium]|nr:magnesium/cobalt transporter CorA [Gammaproteobacteria bacterium]
MTYFEKTYHTPGTAPGTLVSHEGADLEAVNIRLIDYTESSFIEKELATADECQSFLTKDSVTWIHMQGPMQADTIRNIGSIFNLHPLMLEDVLNKGQRPKVEEHEDLLFIIMSMPAVFDDEINIDQVSIFMGDNYIISFHAGTMDPFDPLRNRLRKKSGRIRSLKQDYLLYTIMDLIIDQGYPVLESLGYGIENIEETLLTASAEKTTLSAIHKIRHQLILLRRNLWPQREALNRLIHGGSPLFNESTSIYLRDCYDHTVQILDLIENYREMAASLVDIYISSTSYRLNEIMRVLTIIATIFIPLTFIVGVYGMNFDIAESPWAMPELHWYFGYPLVWGVMIATVIAMVVYFKRKDWF